MVKYSLGSGYKQFHKETTQFKIEYLRHWTFFFTCSLKRKQKKKNPEEKLLFP